MVLKREEEVWRIQSISEPQNRAHLGLAKTVASRDADPKVGKAHTLRGG